MLTYLTWEKSPYEMIMWTEKDAIRLYVLTERIQGVQNFWEWVELIKLIYLLCVFGQTGQGKQIKPS